MMSDNQQIAIDTKRAAAWYFDEADQAISNVQAEEISKILRSRDHERYIYRRDLIVDNVVLHYVGERMDWSPDGNSQRRNFRIASKSLFENWRDGRVVRSVSRSRRDLIAFYVAFGVDLSISREIEQAPLNLAGKVARLHGVRAERSRPGNDDTEVFLVKVEAIDFEPETKNVEYINKDKTAVVVGTCTIGITGCSLRISSISPRVAVRPIIELIQEGQRTQFGACSGLYVKWDYSTKD